MPPFPTGVARQQDNNPNPLLSAQMGINTSSTGVNLRVQISKRSVELDFTHAITTFQLLRGAPRSFWLLIWLGQKLGFIAFIMNLSSCQKEIYFLTRPSGTNSRSDFILYLVLEDWFENTNYSISYSIFYMIYDKVNDTQLSTGMKEHVINTYKNNNNPKKWVWSMLYCLTYFLYYLKTHKFIFDYDKQEHPLCPTLLLWACNSSTPPKQGLLRKALMCLLIISVIHVFKEINNQVKWQHILKCGQGPELDPKLLRCPASATLVQRSWFPERTHAVSSNTSKGNNHPSDLWGLLTWASSPSREAHEVEHVVI